MKSIIHELRAARSRLENEKQQLESQLEFEQEKIGHQLVRIQELQAEVRGLEVLIVREGEQVWCISLCNLIMHFITLFFVLLGQHLQR